MSGKTYKDRAVVLKKTRLGEKDLILTMVDESGALVKAVAKGARKPGGSFAAKLELFSTVDMMLAKGRSLDVVCEARLVHSGSARQLGLEQSACASAIAELACLLAQEGLQQPRLFDMTRAGLDHIKDASPRQALALCAAALWKTMAQAGFRPRFTTCAVCGCGLPETRQDARQRFSFDDGGVVCATCKAEPDSIMMSSSLLHWCTFFLGSSFDDIDKAPIDQDAALCSIQLARQWARFHLNRNVKSIDFLLTSGLF